MDFKAIYDVADGIRQFPTLPKRFRAIGTDGNWAAKIRKLINSPLDLLAVLMGTDLAVAPVATEIDGPVRTFAHVKPPFPSSLLV